MKKYFLIGFLFLAGIGFSTSCQDEAQALAPVEDAQLTASGKDYLVSTKLISDLPQSILQAMAGKEGFPELTGDMKYDVQIYQITYLTTYKGKEIEASGLISVPKNTTGALPILSGQHGTTFEQKDAPSNFPNSFSGFELFASAGYVTVIPDFIGYGVSSQYFHPYYDYQHSALAVVDLIKAAKSFAKKNHIPLNNKLFLTGYSEGGYVTMAAQKEIETNPAHGLKVTAAAAGAGGYDLTNMLSEISADKEYTKPSYLAFILQAYNTTYSWNRPLTDFFQLTYASKLPALFNGITTAGTINRSLSFDPNALFNPKFYADLKKTEGELALKQALTANTLWTNWVPVSPLKMFHGTADMSVFYQNSKVTYDKFVAGGAQQVDFITIPNGTHSSSLMPMMMQVIPWFKSLQ